MPRNGTKNLKPNTRENRTKEEQKQIATKGGIASGKARREKNTLRQCLEILLERTLKDKKGIEMSGAEAASLKVFEKALKGDIRAFEVLRDTAGQKVPDKIMVSEVEQSAIDEVEKMVNDDS